MDILENDPVFFRVLLFPAESFYGILRHLCAIQYHRVKSHIISLDPAYTYFRITGDFDPDIITERLGLQPDKSWKIGDKRRNGTECDFASWEIGRCEQYDVLTENQMHKTIDPLFDKVDLLNRIRNEFNAVFTLEIVPTIYVGNTNPCLAPSLKVIDFCHATRTEIDIDLYVMKQE